MPAVLKSPSAKKLGQQRIGVLKKIKSQAQFKKLWKEPAQPFPFKWGTCWKQVAQYAVNDFAAEVGFFMDVLGFPVNAVMSDYVMFMGPEKEFTFAVVPAKKGKATSPDSFSLQFLISGIEQTVPELKRRGVKFTQDILPLGPGAGMGTAVFKTPHGIPVVLWAVLENPAHDCCGDHDRDEH